MMVQIYGLTTVDDAVATADAGANLIGVVFGAPSAGTARITAERATEIFTAVSSGTHCVALSLLKDPDGICQMADRLRPWAVHLAAHGIAAESVARIRERLKPIRIMIGVAIEGDESVSRAEQYASCADILLLDSRAAGSPVSGATGRTHDWRISRRIVACCDTPVILAGGLGPENVAAAIDAVRPWGVDSLTLTDLPGQRGRKDLARIRAFVKAAKNTDISAPESTGRKLDPQDRKVWLEKSVGINKDE
jgi:phosphoribosylanthranilate isomerase